MKLTDEQVENMREYLRDEVRYIAEGTADWLFNGPVERDACERILAGIEDGDPEILNMFPVVDWSGQWADGPDWEALFSDSLPDDIEWEDGDTELDELCEELFCEIALDYAGEVIEQRIGDLCRMYLGE